MTTTEPTRTTPMDPEAGVPSPTLQYSTTPATAADIAPHTTPHTFQVAMPMEQRMTVHTMDEKRRDKRIIYILSGIIGLLVLIFIFREVQF